MPHMVWTANARSGFDYLSRSWHTLTGETPNQKDKHILDFLDYVHPEDRCTTDEITSSAMKLGREFALQTRYRRHDGVYRYMSIRGSPLKTDDGQILKWYGTLTDIHDKFMLQDENKRLAIEEHEAKEKDRLKTQFLAHMSHELRTPIAAILGMASLAYDTQLDNMQREYLEHIMTSGNNLLALVNDILDLSKIEAGKVILEEVPFEPVTILEETWRVAQYLADKKSLKIHRNNRNISESLTIQGDSGRIRQILVNLFTNAVKFTMQGQIEFNMSIDTISHKTRLNFEVKDTGIGMTQEVQSRIFEPFRQGDASTTRLYGGTGLGLVVSREVSSLIDFFD